MLNNKKILIGLFALFLSFGAYAEDEIMPPTEEVIEQEVPFEDPYAYDAVLEYDMTGSLFAQITELEQQKILLQLEKESLQLQADLERLTAERMRTAADIAALETGGVDATIANEQQDKLIAEIERLNTKIEEMHAEPEEVPTTNVQQPKPKATEFSKRYSVVEIMGAGNQLFATVMDADSGQKKRLITGRELDGYTVREISLIDGVIFEKDGETITLGIE